MKFITFYSESHKNIFEIFLESFEKHLKPNHELKIKKINQISPTGNFNSQGFDLTMMEKINWIIENIDTNSNENLVFSDCDVQFFDDFTIDLSDNDILFQHDFSNFDFSWFPDGKKGISNYPNYCAGFFICKQTEKVKNFFIEVKKTFLNHMNGYLHDQIVINKLISENYNINHGILNSNLFWTVAFSTNGNVWNGQEINVPSTVIMHHANFTIGVENKIKLMNKVKQKIQKN
jgi:hypothetical protein